MQKNIVDPLYNLQRTEENNVLKAVEVETARPLTLTQNSANAAKPGYLFLAPTANVKIFGNELTVSGKLEFPGNTVVIFARMLRAEFDGTTPPSISVNGPPQTVTADKIPQNGKGEDGGRGKNDRAPDIYLPGEETCDGKDGWSGPDHPESMNGKPGVAGLPGNPAGGVYICCERFEFGGDDGKLTITADGGRGGEGQQGQDGAKGGNGGDGADIRGFATGDAGPTKGGNGGRGGAGGKGGNGGEGGSGGKIVFYSALANAEPNLILSYGGGPGGTPGKSGNGGDGGRKGLGGHGRVKKAHVYGHSVSVVESVPDAADGQDGHRGSEQGSGSPASPSKPGEKSIHSGSLDASGLVDLARVSHAQMLFEEVRADYLVTQPADYSIQLTPAMSVTELPRVGHNLIVVGLLSGGLCIQIFDYKGSMVLNCTEDKFLSRDAAKRLRERFELKLDEIILTGTWSAQKRLADLSADARHELFIDELMQISNGYAAGKVPVTDLNDYELAGALALSVFLRSTGSDANTLKTFSIDTQRNGTIAHLHELFGHNIGQLQALDNQKLVLLAKLHDLTNGKADDQRTLFQLSFDEMKGALVMALFLLETGIRDQAALKQATVDGHRNILITEMGGRFGYDAASIYALSNERLVLLAFQPAGHFNIGESLALLSRHLLVGEEEQSDLVQDVGLCTRYVDPWTSIGERLVWATKLLSACACAPTADRTDKTLAGTLHKQVFLAFGNHSNGPDFFGRTDCYTPKLSFDTHESNLTASLKSLQTIEVAKDNYFTSLRESKNETNNLEAALETTSSQLTLLSSRKSKIKEELNKTTVTIDELNSKLNPQQMAPKLREFEKQIKSSFGLSSQTFFNCLGMLSFMNVNEPRTATNPLTKMGGYASAGAMAASQLGEMIKEGVDNVLNDSGEPVPKSYVLSQVEVIKGDIRLQSEFQKREHGFLSADSSKRLVVELDHFRGLCAQFYRSAPAAEKVRKELDGFIESMTTRNSYIDYFNSLLVELRQIASQTGALEAQKGSLQGKLSGISNPGLPSIVNFVSALYERAKATCISDLYNAFRAKAFWALEPYSGFYELLGDAPAAITHATLVGYKSQLLADLEAALENARSTPNIFPKKEESMGAVIVLTPTSHEQFFKDLHAQSWAEFELEPATRSSTQPFPTYSPTTAAWSSTERPIYPPDAPNPFHGKSNVRLTKVRTWMVGMKTDTIAHTVLTTHLGEEQFRRSNDEPYPARTVPAGERKLDRRNPEYVKHTKTRVPFKYDPTDLKYDPSLPDNTAFTPGCLTSRWVPAITDGDLGFPSSGLASLPGKSSYAPIGPFGKWRVDVREQDNHGLNLAGLTAVIVEMHGFSDVFY